MKKNYTAILLALVAISCTDMVTAADQPPAIDMVAVPGGCFQMGSHNQRTSQPVHQVCLDPFQIGKYEITQGQWQAVMGNNPSSQKLGPNYPVDSVSHADIADFLERLNTITGKHFQLPTEAQWEYACRDGGKFQSFCGGGDLETLAWYEANSGGHSHPVGTKSPNGLGIYDMTGNVREWTRDRYGAYTNTSQYNPQGADSGTVLVNRGGSWRCGVVFNGATDREGRPPVTRKNDLGFRVVLENE